MSVPHWFLVQNIKCIEFAVVVALLVSALNSVDRPITNICVHECIDQHVLASRYACILARVVDNRDLYLQCAGGISRPPNTSNNMVTVNSMPTLPLGNPCMPLVCCSRPTLTELL
jgi:hypothetical protein